MVSKLLFGHPLQNLFTTVINTAAL